MRKLVLAAGRCLERGLFGGFVEAERGEFGKIGLTLEFLGEGFEARLGFRVTTDGGQVAAFDEVGGRGGGDLAELPTQPDEFVEASLAAPALSEVRALRSAACPRSSGTALLSSSGVAPAGRLESLRSISAASRLASVGLLLAMARSARCQVNRRS